MEDELKESCRLFKQDLINEYQFRASLRELLKSASVDQLREFAEIVLVGLSNERGH